MQLPVGDLFNTKKLRIQLQIENPTSRFSTGTQYPFVQFSQSEFGFSIKGTDPYIAFDSGTQRTNVSMPEWSQKVITMLKKPVWLISG